MRSIRSAPVFITKQLKELAHILEPIDIVEQVQQEQTWGIIAGRAFVGIAVGHQGTDKGEIDQRSNHAAHTAFDVAVWEYFNEPFFKPITRKKAAVRERFLMGKRNIGIDFVEFFAYSADGEFSKVVHHVPFDPGGSCNFRPDYPISFFLKPFPNGYTNTSFILPWAK